MPYLYNSFKGNDLYANEIMKSVNRELAKPVNVLKFVEPQIKIAISHWERAMEILPEASSPYRNLGIIYSRIYKDYDTASYYFNKTKVAEFGILDNSLIRQFDIKQDVYFADLYWDTLLLSAEGKIKYEEVPKYPEVRRDLALLVNKSVLFSQLEEIAFQVEKQLLKKINLFDIYEGDKIDKNKKSYAVSFILRDDNKTLTDKEIDKIMSRFIKAFKDKLGATLR